MDADCCTEEDDGAIEVLSRNRDLALLSDFVGIFANITSIAQPDEVA